MADSQDRKLPATERRIRQAREDGQVARSRELGHFVAVAGAIGTLTAAAQPAMDGLQLILMRGLRFDAHSLAQTQDLPGRLAAALGVVALAAVPLGTIVALLSVMASSLTGGWNFTTKPFVPNPQKLDPFAGLGRMFAKDHLLEMLKSAVVALVMAGVAAHYLNKHWAQFEETLAMAAPATAATLGNLVVGGVLQMLAVLGAVALADVPLQRWMLLHRLRMSREELKQDRRQSEGNAEVKGRQRARMRQAARRRMMANVPKADVVVMNPTHYAVALRYDERRMAAPRVVAKGMDLVALRIRDIAREAGVPVLTLPPLARALHANVELDQDVPTALFAAVAQVLAWVYQLRRAVAEGRAAPQPPQAPAIPAGLDPAEAESAATQES